ncbi:MAG: hypothetical protein AAF677_01800 [Pseudomonadota bacterium]
MQLAATRDVVAPTARHRCAGDDPAPTLDATSLALLQVVRARAIDAQLAPRVEPYRFCALIEASPDRAAESYIDGLLHVLPQALGRPVLIRRPGPAPTSFDEAWLIGLIMAARRGDQASVRFGLASRVHRPFRRSLGFLVVGIAGRLEAVAP